MLEILKCRRPQDKQSLFSDFDPRRGAWVVPDLQSKWHLQRDLLRRQGALEQASVWRSTELWSHLSFQLHPDLRVVSPELAQTLFWNWIQGMNLSWARSPQAVRVVLRQMQMWMSAFADPRHADIMSEWFQANPEAYVRLGHWFELCAEIWRRCQNDRLVMATWLPAVLLSEDLSQLTWERDLVFDLGPQVSLVEAQLIRELGRHFPVRVVFPEAPWVQLMGSALRPYDDLLSEPYRGEANWQPAVEASLSFGRFTTQLAEVKDTVARLRQWLENGIPAHNLAVVAPDIEAYWPALQLYCAEEGVPVNKPLTARLGSFVEMAQWMSKLRTALGQVSSSDLEISLFTEAVVSPLSYEQFRVLFTHVYDSEDLHRAKDLFQEPRLSSEPLPWKTFLLWGLRQWSSKADPQRLYQLLQLTAQEVPESLLLKPLQWLSYLEGLLARREVTLEKGDEAGVWCVSLSSADWLSVTHAVFLNVSESALRSAETSPVGAGEAQKIFNDTGYAISSLDRQEQEFELLWFLQRPWTELRLNFAATDFSGRVMTPSKFWMWAAFTNGTLKHAPEAPQTTRWDELQKLAPSALARARGWPMDREKSVEQALLRDTSTQISSWKPSQEGRFSASVLERYAECPFLFAAERTLKLSDDPALDLDMDRRTRGRLLHALAEKLSAEPFRSERSEQELSDLVESCRLDEDIRMGDERLWAIVKAQHIRLARLFLNFESEWRRRFPQTQTVARELAFECFWDLASSAPTASPGPLKLSGRVDRVDSDSQGRYALVDYKASSFNLRNWGSWLENDDLQMAFYSLVLEQGLTALPAGKVMAANYYVIKDGDRRKGFHLRDESAELYASSDRHRNFLTIEEKQDLFLGLKDKVQELVVAVLSGQLNPAPVDERACAECSWRKLCRAPHLN